MAPNLLKCKGKQRNTQTGTRDGATSRFAPAGPAPYPSVVPPRFRKGWQRSLSTVPPRLRKGFLPTLGEMRPLDGGEDGDLRGVPPGGSPEPSMTGEEEARDEILDKPTSPVQGQEQNKGVDLLQAAGPLAATQRDASPVLPKKRGRKRARGVEADVPTGKTEEPETRKLRSRSAIKYPR